jgi:hypothetical protein
MEKQYCVSTFMAQFDVYKMHRIYLGNFAVDLKVLKVCNLFLLLDLVSGLDPSLIRSRAGFGSEMIKKRDTDSGYTFQYNNNEFYMVLSSSNIKNVQHACYTEMAEYGFADAESD